MAAPLSFGLNAPTVATNTPALTRGRARFNWVDSFLTFIRVAALVFIAVGLVGTIVNFTNGEGPTAEAWRDLVVGGLAQGAMYGLIALGYSLVYGVLGFIKFAHGDTKYSYLGCAIGGSLGSKQAVPHALEQVRS